MAELTIPQQAVVADLLVALEDEDLVDVTLVSTDGVEIPASRFVLAARSKVLKRMFYGSFREAVSAKIELDYSASTLQAVVQYCNQNILTKSQPDADSIRHFVKVAKAADYLEIPGLLKDAEAIVGRMISEHPLLACPVFDEADEQSALFAAACRMIRCRPYVALAPPLDGGYDFGVAWNVSNPIELST